MAATDTKETPKQHDLHDVREKDSKEVKAQHNEGPVVFDQVEPDPPVEVEPVKTEESWWVSSGQLGGNDQGPFSSEGDAVTAGELSLASNTDPYFLVVKKLYRKVEA